jgi:hypothetical protein
MCVNVVYQGKRVGSRVFFEGVGSDGGVGVFFSLYFTVLVVHTVDSPVHFCWGLCSSVGASLPRRLCSSVLGRLPTISLSSVGSCFALKVFLSIVNPRGVEN